MANYQTTRQHEFTKDTVVLLYGRVLKWTKYSFRHYHHGGA